MEPSIDRWLIDRLSQQGWQVPVEPTPLGDDRDDRDDDPPSPKGFRFRHSPHPAREKTTGYQAQVQFQSFAGPIASRARLVCLDSQGDGVQTNEDWQPDPGDRLSPIQTALINAWCAPGLKPTAYLLVDEANRALAAIEQLSHPLDIDQAIAEAWDYARQIHAPFLFATNGDLIYFAEVTNVSEGAERKSWEIELQESGKHSDQAESWRTTTTKPNRSKPDRSNPAKNHPSYQVKLVPDFFSPDDLKRRAQGVQKSRLTGLGLQETIDQIIQETQSAEPTRNADLPNDLTHDLPELSRTNPAALQRQVQVVQSGEMSAHFERFWQHFQAHCSPLSQGLICVDSEVMLAEVQAVLERGPGTTTRGDRPKTIVTLLVDSDLVFIPSDLEEGFAKGCITQGFLTQDGITQAFVTEDGQTFACGSFDWTIVLCNQTITSQSLRCHWTLVASFATIHVAWLSSDWLSSAEAGQTPRPADRDLLPHLLRFYGLDWDRVPAPGLAQTDLSYFRIWLSTKHLRPSQGCYLHLIQQQAIAKGCLSLANLFEAPFLSLGWVDLGVELFGEVGLRDIINELARVLFPARPLAF